jgi:hypothetical protein
VCHVVYFYHWVRDEEEMLILSLRMEVDSVHNCLITKVFEVMSIWRLSHSIYWLHIQIIQDVEVLSMCRLSLICHSNLVSIVLSQWYMFEFDCVMLWLYSHSFFFWSIFNQFESVKMCQCWDWVWNFSFVWILQFESECWILWNFTLFNTFFKISLLCFEFCELCAVEFKWKCINQLSIYINNMKRETNQWECEIEWNKMEDYRFEMNELSWMFFIF